MTTWKRLLSFAICAVAATSSGTAQAERLSLYLDLGLGYTSLSGQNLIVLQEVNTPDFPVSPGSEDCCPSAGLGADLRFGVEIYDAFAPEIVVMGNGWRLDTDKRGGAGFAGAGLRIAPLGLIDLMADTSLAEIGLNLSFGGSVGYTFAGGDFAYEGRFFGADAIIGWRATDSFSLNLRGFYVVPDYDAFVYTDFGGGQGRCLDPAGAQIGPPDEDILHSRGDERCDAGGSGPEATYLGAQLVASFHFDLL